MTALMDFDTTSISVPAPRTAQPVDPNAWVSELNHSELRLALALSDMPRTRTAIDDALGGYTRLRPVPAPRELNPAGTRTINAWAAQGIERAGGLMTLWQDASRLLEFNRTETWDTPQAKTFTKRFGGIRRLDIARSMVWHVATSFVTVKVRIRVTATTEPVVRELGRRYPLDTTTHQGPYETVYTMRRHHAHLAASAFSMDLVPHIHGGYTLT